MYLTKYFCKTIFFNEIEIKMKSLQFIIKFQKNLRDRKSTYCELKSTYKIQDQEIKTIDAAFYFDQRSKNRSIKIY